MVFQTKPYVLVPLLGAAPNRKTRCLSVVDSRLICETIKCSQTAVMMERVLVADFQIVSTCLRFVGKVTPLT